MQSELFVRWPKSATSSTSKPYLYVSSEFSRNDIVHINYRTYGITWMRSRRISKQKVGCSNLNINVGCSTLNKKVGCSNLNKNVGCSILNKRGTVTKNSVDSW